MIKGISALKRTATLMRRFVKKAHTPTIRQVETPNELMKERLSHVIFQEPGDIIEPFIKEHFDYLRYLGVRD